MRDTAKQLLALPALLLVLLYRSKVLSYETGGALLALVPGQVGYVLRAAWYQRTLRRFGTNVQIGWLTVLRDPRAEVGNNVLIGANSWVSWAYIEDDVLTGPRITTLSGRHHHKYDRRDIPIRQQGGYVSPIRIGHDPWIGSGAVIMAHVAPGSVVSAGAVVHKTFAPYSILGGSPARVIGQRGSDDPPVTLPPQQDNAHDNQ